MKKTLLCLLCIGIFLTPYVACNNSSKPTAKTPDLGETKLLAIYTDSAGNKVPMVVLRVIAVRPNFDSTKGKYEVITDTFWGVEKRYPLMDSLKRPMLDSLKNQLYGSGWVKVGKDSINTHIENISLDSLTKRNPKK